MGSSLIVNNNLFQVYLLIALAGIQIACFSMHIFAEDLGASSVSDPGGRSVQPSSNASNSLQTLYKTEHSGASGASWLRRPDLASRFQMLQILYRSFTKLNILEPRAHHGSGGRSAKPLQVLQFLYKPFTKRSTLEPLAPHSSGGRIC